MASATTAVLSPDATVLLLAPVPITATRKGHRWPALSLWLSLRA